MDMAEIYYIFKFKPKLNRQYNYNEGFCPSMAYFDNKNRIDLKCYSMNQVPSLEKYNDIKYCFVRERRGRHYVYVELNNKKQKMVFSSNNQEECSIICKRIKNVLKN